MNAQCGLEKAEIRRETVRIGLDLALSARIQDAMRAMGLQVRH